MARKNNGNGTTTRTKKTSTAAEIATAPVASDNRKVLVPINLDEEIRQRAYELYLERGSTAGNEQEDWVTAEREVRSRYHAAQSA